MKAGGAIRSFTDVEAAVAPDCIAATAGRLQAERGADRGVPFPRSVPLFLVVTGVHFCVPGGVGLVVGGPCVEVCVQHDAQHVCTAEGGTACIAP